MPDLTLARTLLGLVAGHPVEVLDRLSGRREPCAQTSYEPPPPHRTDRLDLAHDLMGADVKDECARELAAVNARLRARLMGHHHHHDGGAGLGPMLYVLALHGNPSYVIETGVARGLSSASDDVDDNAAFLDFCAAQSLNGILVGQPGANDTTGLLRKPLA